MCLLRDQHRGARVSVAELDDPFQRGWVNRAIVGGKALRQADAPLGCGDRAQLVEASEAAERSLAWGEQTSHDVFEAAGEQIADARALLEDRSHPLGHLIGVAVRLAFA